MAGRFGGVCLGQRPGRGGRSFAHRLQFGGRWRIPGPLRSGGAGCGERVRPSYPAQKPNVSFGRRSGQTLFFKPPSPGVVNSGGFADWVDAPQFSQTRGFLETPFDLTLSSETPGAVLRYTTNGTWPNATNGLVYSGPIPIRGTTILRAAAFKDGLQPSAVKTHTYLFLQDVLRQSTNGAAPPGWPTSWEPTLATTGWIRTS